MSTTPPEHAKMLKLLRSELRQRPGIKESKGGPERVPILIYTLNGNYVYGLASRKDGIRFYALPLYMHAGLLKKYQPIFGKLMVGKSCIRFRKIEEIDMNVLRSFFKDVEKIASVKI